MELLRQLINYETNHMKLLQLVLFAQEDLRDRLAHPRARSFRSRIVMASTLERLSPKETEDMIAFRWHVASGGASHPFEARALRAIFEHSQGVPREACILADNSLLLAYYRKKNPIPADLVRQVARDRRVSLGARKEPHEAKR